MKDKLLIVAFDQKRPIGYIYAYTQRISEEYKNFYPFLDYIEKQPEYVGFVPTEIQAGTYIGEIGNLFVYPQYQGLHIGKTLMNEAMHWLQSHPQLEYLLVNVSNGNNAGTFYEKYGFQYANDVMDGIIKTYQIKLKK